MPCCESICVSCVTEVALNCYWVRNEMKCYTKEGYSFDRQVSDRITLQIPQVSPEQYGRYNCFFFNISSVYSEACVLEKTAGTYLKITINTHTHMKLTGIK